MKTLKIKRAYQPADVGDGYRILIDRLWPRGITKIAAHIDEWNKTIAPSTALRRWFAHREENFATFRSQYEAELEANPESHAWIEHINTLLAGNDVTLVYGARSAMCNHAMVLRDWTLAHLSTKQ